MSASHYSHLKLYQLHDLLKQAKNAEERADIVEAIRAREVAIGATPSK